VSDLVLETARKQAALASDPYDSWKLPEEGDKASFHRSACGFLIRFHGDADFQIDAELYGVKCWPTLACDYDTVQSLYANAVLPLIGNHQGGLNLHGSAVTIGGGAAAFLGLSRSGKTTLAGAFAKAGHAFLTEDVVDVQHEAAAYQIIEKTPHLRVFADSAEYLELAGEVDGDRKRAISLGDALPVSKEPSPLRAIFLLANANASEIAIEKLAPSRALSEILQHSFILDVEDKSRLKQHFARLGALCEEIPCFSLDYPREYSRLPEVITAVENRLEEL
jgi:hypothetical protein